MYKRTTGEICGILALLILGIVIVVWSIGGVMNLVLNPAPPEPSKEEQCQNLGGHLYQYQVYIKGAGTRDFETCASSLEEIKNIKQVEGM